MGGAMDLIREFGALIDVLNREGIEYAVCGGIAVSIHGYVRATTDIDILVRAEDADRVAKLAEEAGFLDDSGTIPFALGTPQQTIVRRIVKIEGRDLLMLDLLLVSPVHESAWQTRSKVDWNGRVISVISRDGLAHMKRLAGRRRDLDDLEQLGIPLDE